MYILKFSIKLVNYISRES